MFGESCARSLSSLSGMLSEEKSMAIKRGNLLVAPGASVYISAAGTKRFLARLSGRRRHVRRTSGGAPGLNGADDNGDACCSNSSSRSRNSNSNSQKLNEDGTTQPTLQEPRTIVPLPTTTPTTTTTATTTINNNNNNNNNNNYTSTSTSTSTTTTTTTTATTIHPAYYSDSCTYAAADAGNTETAATTTPQSSRRRRIPPYIATILIITYTLFGIADACSSRSTPKPRPPTPTPRPNITFHMYTCPPDYAEWYCLNGATCFTVKIAESLLYNCLCANGYIGQRCEFKDLDGSYLPSRQRVMLETASIAGGATIAVFLVVIICIAAYIHCKRKQKELRSSSNVDTVDGPGRDPELRPFSNHGRSLRIFMAKNGNNPTTSPSIEQTRMPGWNYTSPESTRMASISEGKRSNQ